MYRQKVEKIIRMSLILLLGMVCGSLLFAEPSTPAEPSYWAKTYGGSGYEHIVSQYNFIKCTNGGYMLGGMDNSYDTGTNGWISRLNEDGTIVWQKIFDKSDSNNTYCDSLIQTNDGGYIAGFHSWKNGGADGMWIIKFDTAGTITWQRIFTATSCDRPLLYQTSDNGYIIGANQYTAWMAENWLIIKLDSSGNIQWQEAFNPGDVDNVYSILQTADGGYIFTGNYNHAYGSGNSDFCIVKLDAAGNVSWQKRYGGNASDQPVTIIQTSEGFYMVTGYTKSYGAGDFDCWVLKLDSSGNSIWQKTYGGSYSDGGYSIIQTKDGGYALVGNTASFGAGKTDIWVLKLDVSGNISWQKTYGGPNDDVAGMIIQTDDGSFIINGLTTSFGAGSADLWVLKLAASGSCPPFGVDSNCTVTNTNCIPVTMNVPPVNTNYTTTDFNCTVIDTNCVVMQQAMAPLSPIANAGADQTVHTGTIITLNGNQSYDPDGNTSLTYAWSIVQKPDNSLTNINNPNQASCTIAIDASGDYIVQLIVTDNLGLSSNPSHVHIFVTNSAPSFEPIGNKTADEGQSLQFGIHATDADGDTLTYTAFNLPSGASLNPITGAFNWTPDYTQAGDYSVRFEASDGQLTDAKQITIIVNNVNRPPIANAGSDRLNIEASSTSGNMVQLDGSGSSDPDGDGLTYSWTGPFGTITGVNPSVQIPLGNYTITLSVSDGDTAATDDKIISVVDTTAPMLIAPLDITAEATGNITLVSLGEVTFADLFHVTITNNAPAAYPIGETLVTWTATDSNGNAATDTQRVTVRDTTAPTLTLPADVTAEATGTLTAVAIGQAAATDAFAVTVTNNAPGVYPLGETLVTWTATDMNGNESTGIQKITIVDTTAPVLTVPDNQTLVATGIQTPLILQEATAIDLVDGSVQVNNNAPLNYPKGETIVTYTATDRSGNAATKHTKITILNAAPVLAAIENRAINIGDNIHFTVTASDMDGDSLTYSAGNLPDGASFNPVTRAFDWTPGIATVTGSYTIAFTVSDGIVHDTQEMIVSVVRQGILVTVKLLDSTGTGLSDGVAAYAGSSWKSIGTTGTDGSVSIELPSTTGSIIVRMTYGGMSRDLTQNITVNPVFIFETVHTKISLRDSAGNGIANGTITYAGSSWLSIGTTNTSGEISKELLPGSYTFRMAYAGASQDQIQNTGTNADVVFKTKKAVVSFKDSIGVGIPGGVVTYAGNSWQTFGTTNASGRIEKELLPASYTFRLSFAGVTNDLTQNIGTNSTVLFQTQNIGVTLKTSTGNGISGGVVTYAGSSWLSFGTTDASGETRKELLPGNYTFRMTYAGASKDKSQNVGSNPNVMFQTQIVVVTLKSSIGNGLPGGVVTYAGSSWLGFGTTDSNGEVRKELLPVNYNFRMTYAGASKDKSQDTGSDPNVVFQTQNVLVTLKDSTGNGIQGGSVSYAGSSWLSIGATDNNGEARKELLPGIFTFRLSYAGTSRDKTQDIRTDGIIAFQL